MYLEYEEIGAQCRVLTRTYGLRDLLIVANSEPMTDREIPLEFM